MKKYKPYLKRVDLVKNQVERERIQEQEAKRKRKQRIQEQNRQNQLRYQEQLRSELAARYFHAVQSTGGDADTATTSSVRLLTVAEKIMVGPDAAYTDWLVITGSEPSAALGDTIQSYRQSTNGMRNLSMKRVAAAGRGATTYGLDRCYGQLRLNDIPAAGTSGSTVIPGTITAVDLTCRIGVAYGTENAADKLGIFSAGTGSIGVILKDFSLYIDPDRGNRTSYSDFVTISKSMDPNPKEITFSLNSTAIAVMNDQNKTDGELINFGFIWETDFTGTAPTDELWLNLASGSDANEEFGTPADYFIPKFNITYIPD